MRRSAEISENTKQVNHKPRIVIDGRYLGLHASGIGEYVRALVTRVPRLAPDLRFRLWVRDESHVPFDVAGLIEIHQVKAQPNGVVTLVSPKSLDQLTSCDLFHGTYNTLGFGLPCRSVVTVHDVMWLTAPNGCQPRTWMYPLARVYYQLGIRHALRSAVKILTVSEASARRIARIEPGAESKMHVTPNACEACYRPSADLPRVRNRVARMLGIAGDYLLLVGQNQPSKDHETALRAFAKARVASLELVLLQRLHTGKSMLGLARALGVASRVHILGEVPRSDVVSLMQGAIALLQPSRDEGFGLPALEAAACGCPVLASDLPVFHEILGSAARYVPTGDVREWAGAITEIVTDTGLAQRLRTLGPVRAAHFGWDRTADLTLQVYRDALGVRLR